MVFYAVAKGHEVGIFRSWADCEQQVKGYSGAKFKKFKTKKEADIFLANAQQEPQPAAPVKAGISACLSTQAYLAQKYGVAPKLQQEEPNVARRGENFATNTPRRSARRVKKEPFDCLDYIPFNPQGDDGMLAVKQEIKEENMDTSLWFQDSEGDLELLSALSSLEQKSDIKPTSYKDSKQHLNATQKPTKPASPQNKPIRIGRYTFTTDENGFVNAYLGANYENIGSWNCMAGYGVYFGSNHPLNTFKPATGRMTHNVGDIEAAIHAIKTAQEVGIQKLCLQTDSEFLITAMTSWIFAWKNNGWRNKNGKVVQNRKEFQKLNEVLASDNISVKWHNVKGCRSAIKPMQEAKKLAQLGTDEYLDVHPTKDSDNSFGFDGFDFY